MTEQELQTYLQKLAKGCEWYGNNPEFFHTYDNGFMIEIINDNIPEEARLYVEFSNKQTEANRKKDAVLDAMGLGTAEVKNANPPKIVKWGKWED